MVIKANQFIKSDGNGNKKKPGPKQNGSPGFFKQLVAFVKDDRFLRVSGLFLILVAIFLLIAFVSYFFTWRTDQVYIPGETAANWAGAAGRRVSSLMVEKWFGLGVFAFPALFFVYGIKMLFRKAIVPAGKATFLALSGLVWLSVSCGYLFGNNETPWIAGGGFGKRLADLISQALGTVPAGLLLLFILIGFIIVIYNKPLKLFFFSGGNEKKKKNNNPNPREDIYNTVEYAVKDEEDSDEEGSKAENRDDLYVKQNNKGEKKNKPATRRVEIVVEEDNREEIAADQEKEQADVELTIEQPSPVITNNDAKEGDNGNGSPAITQEAYDPTLDLPHYKLPGLDLLDEYGSDTITVRKDELERNKNRIVETLSNYSIEIQKIKATIGSTVTLYEIVPAPGVRISKIKNLEDDIALSLSALGIRIVAPIPGKGTIGIEVPNENPDIVSLKSVLGSEKFKNTRYELPFGMGKTISNESYVADLTKMPHILMAGATGQGKSVGLNVIIASLLYRKHPAELKFILVDPKKVELTLFSKIERHYLAKLPDSEEAIITDTRKVVRTLNSLSIEMDNRYELLKDAQVRNIKEYNEKFKARKLNPLHGHRFLPYFVLVIDEFADLIMTAGKEIEGPITRLAQLARAVGIHLIIATQRPSVNIITGSIKANFPARVAFRVISKIDSRTILDSSGADQLIGRGDMLFSTGSDLLRLQCAFVDIHEIDRITDFIGSQRAYPDAYYLPDYQDDEADSAGEFDPNEKDDLFEEAARIIVQTQQGSTSLLQRKLKLGYNRAGRIIDQLEAAGIVGPFEGSKAREVRIANEMALEQFLRDLGNNL
ncbi:MAG: DNA translocase FtsK 4TM domain-containing protein [Bacteroidales bacterium]|nr:DNA translocase FtsK 4TM domain-containing protein [Bacteroidales bacterium]